MSRRRLLIVLASGLATFLVVGAAVTELLLPRIEFSLFVGHPVGLVAGALVSTGVYLGLSDGTSPQRRRVALAGGAFSAVFLAVLLVAAGLLGLGTVTALGLGALLGVAGAVAIYLRDRSSETSVPT